MTEIEAKFIIRRPEQVGDAMRAFSARAFKVTEHGTAAHLDRYLDTPDWSLLRAGWACRVRRRGGEAKLTLKSLHGPEGHVFAREEINQPLPAAGEDEPVLFPPGPAQEKLSGISNDMPLVELFRVMTERTVFLATGAGPDDSLRLELDLDRTRIEAEKRTEKATGILEFTELELEIVSGSAAELESVVTWLRDDAGLMPAKYSKFERGLQAAGLEFESILQPSVTPPPDEDDPVLVLLYRYLDEQLQIIRRQHPRALEGVDPEGVHQMRVASRRLRTVLKAFRGIVDDGVVSHFNTELRWLAQNLGRARDADVTEKSARESEAVSADHYEDYLAQATIDAYEHLVDILESERCSTLEDELTAFIESGPAGDMREQHGGLSIAACAEMLIGAALARLLTHGDAIDEDSPPRQLHKLRIEAKRFRYLLDFFSTVQADRWLATTEAVKRIQDVLGEHQDAVTAQAHLADYAASIPSGDGGQEKLLETARLLQNEAVRIATSREQFATAWSDFKAMVT